ncbi:MAG: zinc-ribbon domain-containing protein [Paracoccaceae bacterium]
MRLVCPNCSAQYEIDGSMIPEEGRDVQCSNCGHTWFELPGPAATEAAPSFDDEPEAEDEFDAPPAYDLDDDDSFEDDTGTIETDRRESVPDYLSREDFEDPSHTAPTTSDWDDEPDAGDVEPASEPDVDLDDESSSTASAEPEPEPEIEAKSEDDEPDASPSEPEADSETEDDASDNSAEPDDATETDDPETDDDPADDLAGAGIAAATRRRPADAAALDILREEAERELSQRRALPSEGLETQADLGLGDIRNRRTPSRALRARMAHMGEEYPEDAVRDDDFEVSPAPVSAPRSTPQDDDGYEEPRRDLLPDIDEINSTLKTSPRSSEHVEGAKRSGFRFGFLIMLFLTIAAIFAYAQAPAIARALPQTEPTLISYVDWANGLRDWLNGLLGR